jgi:hypothetical protein
MSRIETRPPSDERIFLIAIGGTVLMGLGAYGLGFLLDRPLGAQLSWTLGGAIFGLGAVAPLTVLLWLFSRTKIPALARFRQSQIQFYAEVGFEFTPRRILAMAAVAGVAEELMFRGVLQSWLAGFAPLMIAIVAPNIIFGLLHMRTLLFGLIAGCVGVYLGALFALSGNMLVPIITHGVYDLIALEYTRRAIRAWREKQRKHIN